MNVVVRVFHKVKYRNYASHIYVNWYKIFKGKELKDMFWRVVTVYNEVDIKDVMEDMRKVLNYVADVFFFKILIIFVGFFCLFYVSVMWLLLIWLRYLMFILFILCLSILYIC